MTKFKFLTPYVYLVIIYLLIFIQYPVCLTSGYLLLSADISKNIEPSYLIIWGLIRILFVLPLVYELLNYLDEDHRSIYLHIGDRNRVIRMTFWMTLIFTLIGTFIYPYFVMETGLTLKRMLFLVPIFSLYAISNAFVEETFFRGTALLVLTKNTNFFWANTLQATFFALIHIINPMSNNLFYFVLLTFFLGIIWGIMTKHTKSLIPAILCHIVADFFVAISLF